jgi:hypothetical protein
MSPWFELWADFGQTPPYVLVVQCRGSDIDVLDPQENRRKIFTAQDYETVFNWLREDEFELAKGRVAPEDEV